ncbi:UDP-N-acetylglucosamine 1-carboxyvinyltransferase [Mahella sp.]|uniref:UDP-N-acetylglucosamine 1-carboxyvinyltransferase n=1 Tax=Mahella sp. TaxID=2798721 RepID=UPI0025BB8A8E|nr:UDP-N-acetylglucosamine 1-carboxyvinyltransferase [Mahella sp.]MBZ4665980.1 UDP-N-acetylglucosamine 1-carboxyvinyltransferase [Mahella sp.]
MDKLLIYGGKPLKGEVCVGGCKNSAVAVIPAAILADSPSTIENLPYIDDVLVLKDILAAMGAKAELTGNGSMYIDPAGISTFVTPMELARRMRASYYLLGVLLAKFGRAEVAFPGGCDIGVRPIDQHIKGLEALGAKISIEHGFIKAYADGLKGAEIYLDVVSVGATINIMLAASMADGVTEIVNAAKEPHVVDTANFLNAMGANIKGAGTDVVKIKGVKTLRGCRHSIVPDQIEAGTFMIAAAATYGDVIVRNVIPVHLESVSAKMSEMGIEVAAGDDFVHVKSNGRPKHTSVKTLPYPGFPTDLQQPMSALLSVADGTSIITENIWESRYKHIEEIKRMGAKIKIEDRVAIIDGVDKLTGAPVTATDLRAGAALVVAGLMAEGVTEINNAKYIDRGYENIDKKLISLGADIKRISI